MTLPERERVFSEQDLARLKADNFITHPDNIRALLTRLETSERLNKAWEGMDGTKIAEAREAHKKSKGE